MSGLIVPKVEPVTVLDLHEGHLTEYGRFMFTKYRPIAGAASFSNYLEDKLLDHIFNDGTFSAPSPSLALCTTAPTDSSTGATIVEATGATGYARLAIAASDVSASSGGSKTNSAALTFPAITAGSATVVGWAICDSGTTGAGNMLVWGTATSTVISTTQTPPTVAIGGLVVTLD